MLPETFNRTENEDNRLTWSMITEAIRCFHDHAFYDPMHFEFVARDGKAHLV